MAEFPQPEPNGNYARSAVEIVDEEVAQGRRTLTPLGRRLLEALREIEKAGIPSLTPKEIERERFDRAYGARGDF